MRISDWSSDVCSSDLVAMAIDTTLGFPYRTSDWQQQNSSLFRALKLEKLGMAVILTLIIIVAAFNIVSTLTMVVRDKTRERSDERRGGKEVVRTCKSRWSQAN